MIKSRKHKLLIALILVCTCCLAISAEPNEAKTELKFEIKQGLPQPDHMRLRLGATQGIYKHYAVLFVAGDWQYYRNPPIEVMLETSAGQSMSKMQREYISNHSVLYRDNGSTISNYTYFQLLGVSEEDVKKMVNAFIEILENFTNKEMQRFLNEQQEFQEKIADIKKKLLEKQKQFKEAESKYMQIKDARYFPHNSNETYRKAKETMFQMDKTLDTLEIELAGIQEKLKSLESYRRAKRLPNKALSDETLDKLDQMFVEQMIELSSAKARQHAALQIRKREKVFLVLFNQRGNFESEVNGLKDSLKRSEINLRSVERVLVDPAPSLLPPKVFQNKVTIYPVK